ncbi:hypothetical protein E4U23_008333 [Claviceps purpurea]|nr:hypothetical protein E4U23_008333 [Claviceps purpurea]
MDSISTPIQTAKTSDYAEVKRGLIDYLVDQLQKSTNLPAVQDGAECAQLKTQLDGLGNTLTDVKGTVIAIQGTVRAIRDDVKGIRDDVKGLQGGVTSVQNDVASLRSDVSNIRQDVACLNGDITSLRKYIRVIGENIGRQVDSMCNMISNVDSRSNKSRQDQAEVKVKVNIKLKTS